MPPPPLHPNQHPTWGTLYNKSHYAFEKVPLCFFLGTVQNGTPMRVDPEWWHLSWRAANLYSAKLLEASCQRDKRQQREAQDLKSTFCTHRITNSEKVWRNYSNCRGICNYYKSSQPTKAMLSTLHEVHWKALRTKVDSCMGPFSASNVCSLSFIIKERNFLFISKANVKNSLSKEWVCLCDRFFFFSDELGVNSWMMIGETIARPQFFASLKMILASDTDRKRRSFFFSISWPTSQMSLNSSNGVFCWGLVSQTFLTCGYSQEMNQVTVWDIQQNVIFILRRQLAL